MKLDEVNINLIKAYVSKRYRIYKIDPIVPISRKHRREFAFYDEEAQEELSPWKMSQYLIKLFSVDIIVVHTAFKELVEAEAIKIHKQQLNIPYTGYFRKTKKK